MVQKAVFVMMAALIAAFVLPNDAQAGKRGKTERIVREATQTVNYFASDDAYEGLWSLSDDAKAMVIIPQSIRAGFIFGGSAGDAVMLSRQDDGTWSQPVFLTVGSFSVGLQAGGEASEIVLLVMTNRGKEQLLSTSVKLGADLTIAAGPVGVGGKAQTTDILAFSRSRGLYGGVSLEGAVLKIRHSYNKAYYGSEISPADIIYREQAYNPSSTKLQKATFSLANRQQATMLAPLQPVHEPGQPTANPQPATFEDDEAWGAPVKPQN